MAILKDLLVNGNSSLLGTTTAVSILPQTDASYNLGSTSLGWKTIYLANTTGAAYDNGLRLYNSGTLMGSIGVGSDGIGIYGNGNVYIRPVLNAATSGFKVTTTKIVPAADGTIDLGSYDTSNNTSYKWKDVHATQFISRAAAATTGGTTGFTIKDTSNNIYGTFRIYTAGTTSVTGLTILALGNSKSATTTANAAGCLTIYGTDQAYTDLRNALTGSTNRIMYLPNYAGNGYLTHTASASAVGGDNTPVYVAANGRITAINYTIDANVPSDAVFTDTKNTAGSTDTSSKIYLIGATEQAANPQTYSDNEVFVTNGVLDAKEVSTSKLYIYGNKTTDKTNRFLYSDLATNMYASIDGTIALVLTKTEVRRGASATTVNLGSSTYKWNNIYGNIGHIGDITISGASTDSVARYRLSSSSTLYLNRGSNCSLIFQENGTSYIQILKTSNDLIPVTAQTEKLNLGLSTNKWKAVYAKDFYGSGSNLTDIYVGSIAKADTATYNTTPEVASIKVGNGTAAAAGANGCTMQYDETLQTLKFVFA